MSEKLTVTRITETFLRKVLKKYTRRAEDREARKNGVKKQRVTKELICNDIINDMEKAGLI